MNILYKNKKTEKLCTDFSYACKNLPNDVAEKLLSHICYIKNSESFRDIVNNPAFHFHKLRGNLKDFYTLDVGRKLGYRIKINPLNEQSESLIKEKDFNIILDCTKIILIVEVSNHYE